MDMGLGWGLMGVLPKDVKIAFGARAIVESDGRVSFLHDRKDAVGYDLPGFKEFANWVNTVVVPKLHKKGFRGDDDALYTFENENYRFACSPRGSFGYLYISAWEKTGNEERFDCEKEL